jgi:hypothetical protein
MDACQGHRLEDHCPAIGVPSVNGMAGMAKGFDYRR